MDRERKNILLVEDDADVSFVLSEFLKKAGFRVRVAKTRGRAEALLGRHEFDLIISDSSLRGCSASLLRNIPTLLMSGHPRWISTLKDGPTPFIAKPFHPDELLLAIQMMIDENFAAPVKAPN